MATVSGNIVKEAARPDPTKRLVSRLGPDGVVRRIVVPSGETIPARFHLIERPGSRVVLLRGASPANFTNGQAVTLTGSIDARSLPVTLVVGGAAPPAARAVSAAAPAAVATRGAAQAPPRELGSLGGTPPSPRSAAGTPTAPRFIRGAGGLPEPIGPATMATLGRPGITPPPPAAFFGLGDLFSVGKTLVGGAKKLFGGDGGAQPLATGCPPGFQLVQGNCVQATRTPGIVGAAQRIVPGGATGFEVMGAGIGCPSGFHPNKSSYMTQAGFVEKGTRCVRNRRRNNLNPRALRRAGSRIGGFYGEAIKIDKVLKKSVRKGLGSGRR